MDSVPEASRSLPSDFEDFIDCLKQHAVEYILVGGYALGAHGVIRATGDIDFLYRRTTPNVTALCRALADFGAPADIIDLSALMTEDVITQFGVPPLRIDLLNAIDGVDFVSAWDSAIERPLGRHTVRVIGLDALIRNKLASGRDRDLLDVQSLQSQRQHP
jgi:hypothetical protein